MANKRLIIPDYFLILICMVTFLSALQYMILRKDVRQLLSKKYSYSISFNLPFSAVYRTEFQVELKGHRVETKNFESTLLVQASQLPIISIPFSEMNLIILDTET